MRSHRSSLIGVALVALLTAGLESACAQQPSAPAAPSTALVPDLSAWDVHDLNRPQPVVIDPGVHAGLQDQPAPPPADAIVLFGGDDLSAWESEREGPAKWNVENGYFEIVPGTGGIRTKEGFGDVQLHLEFATPNPAKGEGQDRGNSGVFLMKRYEVQVLDSYGNTTYPDGQASAVYGQYPPLVNASRGPGMWQTYDIFFTRPRFAEDSSLASPARVTVLHNGVLVQHDVVLTGPTEHHARPPYTWHSDREPLQLQDHDHPTRFRNIWVRSLE